MNINNNDLCYIKLIDEQMNIINSDLCHIKLIDEY